MQKLLILLLFCLFTGAVNLHGQKIRKFTNQGLTYQQKYSRNRNPFYADVFYRPTSRGPVRVATPEGYTLITELNSGMGLGTQEVPYSANQLGLTMVHGYHFTPYLLAGGGLGFQSYNEGTLAPLFVDLRYYFRMGVFNPFIMADAGGIFRLFGEETKGGSFIYPAVGIRLAIAYRTSLTLAAGWHAHWVQSDGDRDSFVSIRAGIVFF